MKSFLRFLSNHKLYASIEVFGLSLAMAFVILLSAIIIEDNRTDAELANISGAYIQYRVDISRLQFDSAVDRHSIHLNPSRKTRTYQSGRSPEEGVRNCSNI